VGTGELIRAEIQRATLDIGGFIQISGGIYFEKASGTVVDAKTGLPTVLSSNADLNSITSSLEKLKTDGILSADNQTLSGLAVDTLTIGAGNVDIFIGYGPYFIDSNNDGVIDDNDTPDADAFGIKLEDIDLGLVIMDSTDEVDPDKVIPKFFALQALWPDPIDIDLGFLQFDVDDLRIQANLASKWKGTKITPFIDFKSSFTNGYEIPAPGSQNGNFVLDYNRGMIGVSLGHALLSIDGFFTIEGSFAFEKGFGVTTNIQTGFSGTLPTKLDSTTKTELNRLKAEGYVSSDYKTITDMPMDVISIGAADVNIYVGDIDDPLMSFLNIDFGVSIFTASKSIDLKQIIPKMYAFKATIPSAVDIDFGGIQLKVDDLNLQANSGKAWKGLTEGKPFIDFQTSFDNGYDIQTGGAPINIDFNRGFVGVEIGNALVSIGDFLYLQGAFSIEKTENISLDVVTGFNSSSIYTAPSSISKGLKKMSGVSSDFTRIEDVTMKGYVLGGSGINAFIGMGPYFVDSNNDGKIDGT
ncbi:hypothetical protein MJH12_06425, partial [bacterium]|nr:hypothetical protein [bacterium]